MTDQEPFNCPGKYSLPTSNSSPRTWIWYLAQSILCRIYDLPKHELQYFLGYPVRPPGFSSYRGYGKVTSRVHSCANTRQGMTDPEVVPSWSLRPRYPDMLSRWTHSKNIDLSRALFGYCNTQNHRVTSFNLSQIPPDGSEMSDLLSGVCHRWWSWILLFHSSW
jgi:hypothetical protein